MTRGIRFSRPKKGKPKGMFSGYTQKSSSSLFIIISLILIAKSSGPRRSLVETPFPPPLRARLGPGTLATHKDGVDPVVLEDAADARRAGHAAAAVPCAGSGRQHQCGTEVYGCSSPFPRAAVPEPAPLLRAQRVRHVRGAAAGAAGGGLADHAVK